MVLGITGGTGCGKTTLLRRAAALGALDIDCDAVYHRLLAADAALRRALEARFPDVVRAGAWDRKALGAVVFGDPAALRDLNAIAHPFVCAEVRRLLRAAADRPFAAIDAVALLESGLGALCGVTVAVTAPPERRAARLVAREGVPEDYARLRIAAQPADAAFAARCGRTLHNDYPTEAQFAAACDRFLLALLEEFHIKL